MTIWVSVSGRRQIVKRDGILIGHGCVGGNDGFWVRSRKRGICGGEMVLYGMMCRLARAIPRKMVGRIEGLGARACAIRKNQ